jgi:hypothetical protein
LPEIALEHFEAVAEPSISYLDQKAKYSIKNQTIPASSMQGACQGHGKKTHFSPGFSHVHDYVLFQARMQF